MSDTNGHGPSLETLKNLEMLMPAMVKDMEERRQPKIISIKAAPKPTKVCAVCGVGFDHKHVSGALPDVSLCLKCHSMLLDGWTALISHDHYALVPPHPKMKPYAGKICPISAEDMQRVLDQMQLQKLARNGSTKEE